MSHTFGNASRAVVRGITQDPIEGTLHADWKLCRPVEVVFDEVVQYLESVVILEQYEPCRNGTASLKL